MRWASNSQPRRGKQGKWRRFLVFAHPCSFTPSNPLQENVGYVGPRGCKDRCCWHARSPAKVSILIFSSIPFVLLTKTTKNYITGPNSCSRRLASVLRHPLALVPPPGCHHLLPKSRTSVNADPTRRPTTLKSSR